ncbi:MAG: PadR family transcriptional regulator [Desulfomonilaceae bacterium]
MTRNSRKGQAYRHTPAFILLFLARETLYGGALMTTMQRELPCYVVDSAVIYRALKDLEQEGAVKSYWETDISGPARKWYTITDRGLERLTAFKADIEMRKQNFEFFLDFYNTLVQASPVPNGPEAG